MLSHWRQTFREQYSWLLLPVFLVVAFTVDNRTGVTNVMRVLCFPLVLFALTARDYKAIWANPAARAFWLFIGWLNITLLWDGLSETDWDFFQRNVYLFTLMGMVYLVAAYKPEKQNVIFYTYLFGGFACALLILWDWPGTPAMIGENFHQMDPEIRQKLWGDEWLSRLYYYTRGIMSLSHYVGWMMSVVLISALYAAINDNTWKNVFSYLVAAICSVVLAFAQARGAWLGAAAGMAMMLIATLRLKTLLCLGILAVVLCAALVALPGMEQIWAASIGRGDSYRFFIWQEAVSVFLANPFAILVGFGQSVPTTYVEGHVHLHNIYLNTLSYGGLVGVALYGRLIVHTVRQLMPMHVNMLLLSLLLCMQVAFLVDGEYLFVTPSAMMLGYLLPLMWAMFGFKPLQHATAPLFASPAQLPPNLPHYYG